jgi:SAM-dependent methyltransferase
MTTSPAHDHAARAASFRSGATNYAAVRPTYPDAAVEFLLGAAPPAPTPPAPAMPPAPSTPRVLDLAAGTGKLTASLVARGLDVVAVDPSAAMIAELAASLPDVETHLATAEEIPLPAASVDAVVVGQAWHWFDEPAASAETARILRHGGTLGVVWNDRDTSRDWVARFGEILHRGDQLEPMADRVAPRLGPQYDDVEHGAFPWTDWIATASLRPLAASRSYLLTLPDDEREELLAAVDKLVATHPDLAGRDRVALPYVAHAYRARRR